MADMANGRSRRGRAVPDVPWAEETWLAAIGRPYPGAYGIARSYEEVREGLTTAIRLCLDTLVIPPRTYDLSRAATRSTRDR
jgi:hypothetical protein